MLKKLGWYCGVDPYQIDHQDRRLPHYQKRVATRSGNLQLVASCSFWRVCLPAFVLSRLWQRCPDHLQPTVLTENRVVYLFCLSSSLALLPVGKVGGPVLIIESGVSSPWPPEKELHSHDSSVRPQVLLWQHRLSIQPLPRPRPFDILPICEVCFHAFPSRPLGTRHISNILCLLP